ncbi:CHAT domain-containing protein [Muriicola sp. Z0-33]|uniref:CHAT domain-containing protein n=1 Tax=Muriicola sp. Z0-33 TaxID=2816957 RepID=UPI002238D840|nr:CHAT domain-containing tetratricopeptide repeat protein [Muriicola sp. Z0-33]MCW5516892.1 CHAT domain-containing protein [Muriicola sp. Z0-33]
MYTKKDSAYYYFDQISEIATGENDWINVIETGISLNRIAGYHYDLEKMRENISFLDSLLRKQESFLATLPERKLYFNSLLYDKGAYHFEVDNFNEARNYFEKLLSATENYSDTLFIAEFQTLQSTAYSFMAKMYTNEGKYDLAKQYYEKNIRFISQIKPVDEASLHINYSLLAEVYKKEGKYDLSNAYFIRALKFYIANNGNTNRKVSVAQNIVQNYLKLAQIDSAQYYLDLMKLQLPAAHPFWNRYYRSEGELYSSLGDYSAALKSYKESLRLYKEKWKTKKHEEIALVYNEIGVLLATKGDQEQGLMNLDLGLTQLVDFDTGNTPQLILNSNGNTLLRLLKNKTQILAKLNTEKAYLTILDQVDFGVSTLDKIKPTFKSEEDKLLLIEEAIPLFETGLEAAYQMYSKTKDKSYLSKAFYYAEKSKSVLLLEVLMGTKAVAFAKIPDSILERERQLKSLIANVEKKLNRAKNKNSDLSDQLFQLNTDHRLLSSNIETNFPAYFNLKYNNEVASIAEVKNRLDSDEQMISYFQGNKALYVLSIEKNDSKMLRIPLDLKLEELISSCRIMLGNPKSDVRDLAKISYRLYNYLLQPLIAKKPNQKLIIVPDGLLNYLPFSALNTSSDRILYLMETSQISYANSATLLAELDNRKINNDNVLGFAPSFEQNKTKSQSLSAPRLFPLPHNGREVKQVLAAFGGNSFQDEVASLENFTNEAEDYGIIHLATHAKYNDNAPEFSYLAFTPENDKEYLLYVKDLYQLELKADLVTLSACESGIGELKRGEGLIGLTRGFFYGGASSIVSTLWNINDASSSQLMGSFYKNLSQGNAKDLALQQSKLTFLNANRENALSHPYYWSGFIISGNTNPISKTSFLAWYVLGVMVLAFVSWFLTKKLG